MVYCIAERARNSSTLGIRTPQIFNDRMVTWAIPKPALYTLTHPMMGPRQTPPLGRVPMAGSRLEGARRVRTADAVSEQELGELKAPRPEGGHIPSYTKHFESVRPAGRKRRLRMQGRPDTFLAIVRLEAAEGWYCVLHNGGDSAGV